MPIPKSTAKTKQPETPAPTNIFCFDDDDDDDNDDNVDDGGLGESGSATERWLPFKVGKWVVHYRMKTYHQQTVDSLQATEAVHTLEAAQT